MYKLKYSSFSPFSCLTRGNYMKRYEKIHFHREEQILFHHFFIILYHIREIDGKIAKKMLNFR